MIKRVILTIAILILAVTPVLAEKTPPVKRIQENITDIAPYDRITGYNFQPYLDYNSDGIRDINDCFIEFYHHQANVSIVEIGILSHWQSGEASYKMLRLEGISQGYNRFYSREFYHFNLLGDAIYIVGHSHYPGETIDNLDYESLSQSPYPIVDYGLNRRFDMASI